MTHNRSSLCAFMIGVVVLKSLSPLGPHEWAGFLVMMAKADPLPNIDSSTCASLYLSPRNKQAKILWHVPMPGSFQSYHTHELLCLMLMTAQSHYHLLLHEHLANKGAEFKCGLSSLNLKTSVLYHSMLSTIIGTEMVGCYI